ncbi:50S ribosomal protein L25 [Candidatus Saccharibacteria bacterium]|nr:50S ribosomal protein L25 [Candidatus Saccharibacteria bacterium]
MVADVDKPVQLSDRAVVRKGLAGLRQEGLVPAVIHNHGQPSLHVMGGELELGKIYRVAGKHHPLELHVGSQQFLALIKEVQFNPVKRRMQHIVFQAIRRDEKVEAEVPVKLIGEVPAEKVGLLVLHQLDHVEVEALPKNLPDELTLDATKLVELHDKLTVGDITPPTGVTVLTEPDHPVATVVETRAQVAEEAAEETAEVEETGEESDGAENAENQDAKSE